MANMYFVAHAAPAPAAREIGWTVFAVLNLLPVTLGNVIGGAVLFGAMYWFVYLRLENRTASEGGGGGGEREFSRIM